MKDGVVIVLAFAAIVLGMAWVEAEFDPHDLNTSVQKEMK